jgi:hypothetical protein
LQLEIPLDENYSLFAKTGKPGAGDSSGNIQTGKIVAMENNYCEIDFTQELLQKAEQAYLDSRQAMIQLACDKCINNL